MPVSGSTLIHDTVLLYRALLASGVTDPISRPSGEQFIMTAWPERPVTYPVVLVNHESTLSSKRVGSQSNQFEKDFLLKVEIASKSVKQRDELYDAVFQTLHSVNAGSLITNNVFNFRETSAVNVDEPGKEGLHRKIITFQQKFFV